jgi:hypothetical protein
MDLIKLLEIAEDRELNINLIVEGNKIFEVRAKDRNIDIEIVDPEAFKNILKELRR